MDRVITQSNIDESIAPVIPLPSVIFALLMLRWPLTTTVEDLCIFYLLRNDVAKTANTTNTKRTPIISLQDLYTIPGELFRKRSSGSETRLFVNQPFHITGSVFAVCNLKAKERNHDIRLYDFAAVRRHSWYGSQY